MKTLRDAVLCFLAGLALAWMFIWGLDLHYESIERPPWSKPSAVEVPHGR